MEEECSHRAEGLEQEVQCLDRIEEVGCLDRIEAVECLDRAEEEATTSIKNMVSQALDRQQ